jgi:two-component system, NtrC family, sensor histidine kinase HydH
MKQSMLSASPLALRAEQLFLEHRQVGLARMDRIMAVLMIAQWVFGIVVALTLSPYAWVGTVQIPHVHLYAAVFLGGAISSLPIALAWTRPGWLGTRLVIAVAQMLWSALLIHLTGGRIETHFHVFGSLAFLAFYRDWRVLVPATLVVAADHLVRQMFWPESVYGIANPEWWRFLEHAFWVAFEDIVLVIGCVEGVKEMRAVSQRTAEVEALSQSERDKSVALDLALGEIKSAQEALVRTEKLAAVGQLAASVGHELRNPLAAVRNANTYVRKRLAIASGPAGIADPKIEQFLAVIEREVSTCTRIISDLLDFARERAPILQPCPLRPLVDDAVAILPKTKTRIVNAVPDDLPIPSLDRDHFRQVLANVLQNAVEAIPNDRDGEVVVHAEAGAGQPWRIMISDNGIGIPDDVVGKIFEPLFTTRAKGTGLGLAIVAGMVKAHQGNIHVETTAGSGTRFTIELPPKLGLHAAYA